MSEKELAETYQSLKKKITPYEKKLKVAMDRPHRYDLCGDKVYNVTSERTGKTSQKKDAAFVSIIMQKDYVGFYFMPIYYHKGLMDEFSEAMNKRLKGKCCFHFKKPQEVDREVDKLLKKGFAMFKENNFV